MSVTQQLKDLVQGKTRMLSDRELAERDFEGFFTWLKAKGVASPYYLYPKEAWALWRFQRDYGVFVREQQEDAQAHQQQRDLFQALKDPATGKGAVLAAVMSWPQEQRDDLVAFLTPPILPDEPPADVQADGDGVGAPPRPPASSDPGRVTKG